jgi:hypothetical protein
MFANLQDTGVLKVSLSGGLGNQLFQFAAGLNYKGDRKLVLTTNYGYPRTNSNGIPDLLGFRISDEVELRKNLRTTVIFQRLINLSLRLSSNDPLRRKKMVKNFVLVLVRIFSLNQLIVKMPNGVGFDSTLQSDEKKLTMVGYFQTIVFADNPKVNPILRNLELQTRSNWVEEMHELSRKENPLILHLRLGDYRNENFGILDTKYFRANVENLLKDNVNIKSIWLFSDEAAEALEKLGPISNLPIRKIGGSGQNPCEILEAMTFGSGYIISNSTFSWWGAYLRKKSEAKVIAPNPWFLSGRTPKSLYPKDWILADAIFQNE